MKAAMFYGPNQPLKIEEIPTPEPKDDEILVKVAACGVCHTDIGYTDHGVPTFMKPPMILGHECSGIVDKAGSAVKKFKEGDRVLIPAVLTCGQCSACREGRENICANMVMLGNHINGAYAEYIAVPAKDICPLPEEIPLEEGSIIADAISTPYHAVINRAKVKAGQSVVVVGCGGVGINVVQVAAAVGGAVIAIDIEDKKLEMAKKLGATATINPNKVEKLPKEIRKLTGGGADIAFEAIGNPDTINTAFSCLRVGGRLVVVGYTAKPVPISAAKIMFQEMEVIGSLGCRPVDYPRCVEIARMGKIKVKELVTSKFSLDDIESGFELLRKSDPGTLRSIIVP